MADLTFTYGSHVADSIFGMSQAPITRFLKKRAEAFEQQSMLPKLFTFADTKHAEETISGMTGYGDFEPVEENGAYPTTGFDMGFEKRIKPYEWKNSFSISQTAVEDSKLVSFRKPAQGFISGYYRTREKFGAALYGAAMNGESKFKFGKMEFDATGADGMPLFHMQHPAAGKRGKKQSNVCSDAFSKDALSAAETAMQNFRDDQDEVLAVTPDTIVIANKDYTLKDEIFSVIGADKDPHTSNNAFNYQFGRWNVILWPYLNKYVKDGSSPWILLDSDYLETNDAVIWLNRLDLAVRSTVDDNTDANTWRGRARFGANFVDWRFAFCGGVSGADSLLS